MIRKHEGSNTMRGAVQEELGSAHGNHAISSSAWRDAVSHQSLGFEEFEHRCKTRFHQGLLI